MPNAILQYEPGGIYPEGPSYWVYGTTYNVLFIDALETALGSSFDIAGYRGFMRSPYFMLHAAGPAQRYFNFADSSDRIAVAPAMHWFANRLDDPSLLRHQREALAGLAKETPVGGGHRNRFLPFLFMWGKPLGRLPEPQQMHWHGRGATPVAFHRSAWHRGATYIGIKGGSPSANHGHMDAGSFVLDMRGQRWAIDLGAQSYHDLEEQGLRLWDSAPDGDRWKVFRLNTLSHNTLVVNGQQQHVTRQGDLMKVSDDPDNPFAVFDLKYLYLWHLAEASRGVRLFGEPVLIQDDVVAPDTEARIRWGMATNAEIELQGHEAVLRQKGRRISAAILSPPGATFTVIDMETPPAEHDAANPNTRMLAFEVTVAPHASETLAVYFEPGAFSGEHPVITPVAEW